MTHRLTRAETLDAIVRFLCDRGDWVPVQEIVPILRGFDLTPAQGRSDLLKLVASGRIERRASTRPNITGHPSSDYRAAAAEFFHPEWCEDLTPWEQLNPTSNFWTRCLLSAPDDAICWIRHWGGRSWRACFSPPDEDTEGQDWDVGEIRDPDGHYWKRREDAEAATEAAFDRWRVEYRRKHGREAAP